MPHDDGFHPTLSSANKQICLSSLPLDSTVIKENNTLPMYFKNIKTAGPTVEKRSEGTDTVQVPISKTRRELFKKGTFSDKTHVTN
jgi:hypothetical protein